MVLMPQHVSENKIGQSLSALVLFPLLTSCHSFDDAQSDASFNASTQPFPTQVAPFDNYKEQVFNYLSANRSFVGTDKSAEIAMNMPFECGISVNDKGLFLVHGLGDSPYFCRELAATLCEKGLRVRVMLLPGHGSKPGDMLSVSYEQWQAETDFQLEQFASTVEQLYVGGFSTGANLTTISAFDRNDINGMIHFSPAFKSRFFVSKLAPYIDTLYPWPNVEAEDNPSRYNSTAMPGFAAYQESVNALARRFDNGNGNKTSLDVPVLMVLAEKDSVVDTQHVAQRFKENFTNDKKCLLWQGEEAPDVFIDNPSMSGQLLMQSMNLPEERISAASHMSSLFSARNSLYGTQSTFKICDNGQGSESEARCKEGKEGKEGKDLWYGPWGYDDEDANRVYARLTYNPYFDAMIDKIVAFTSDESAGDFCTL